jgi:ClpP class serine protease
MSQFVNDYVKAYESNSVTAIVLNIDSPGGDVRGVGDAADIMFRMAQKGRKPVKAFAFGYMASAAYYIGSIANDITGSKTSIAGSIGVVLQVESASKDSIEIVSSQSPYKRLDPKNDKHLERINTRLDDLAEIMVSDIAKFRGVTPEKVLSDYGQGDVYVGPRAKKQGVIDKIGTLSSVVAEAAKEAEGNRKVVGPRNVRSIGRGYEAVGAGAEAVALLSFRCTPRRGWDR